MSFPDYFWGLGLIPTHEVYLSLNDRIKAYVIMFVVILILQKSYVTITSVPLLSDWYIIAMCCIPEIFLIIHVFGSHLSRSSKLSSIFLGYIYGATPSSTTVPSVFFRTTVSLQFSHTYKFTLAYSDLCFSQPCCSTTGCCVRYDSIIFLVIQSVLFVVPKLVPLFVWCTNQIFQMFEI